MKQPTMNRFSIELDEQTGLYLQARAQSEGLNPQEWVARSCAVTSTQNSRRRTTACAERCCSKSETFRSDNHAKSYK